MCPLNQTLKSNPSTWEKILRLASVRGSTRVEIKLHRRSDGGASLERDIPKVHKAKGAAKGLEWLFPRKTGQRQHVPSDIAGKWRKATYVPNRFSAKLAGRRSGKYREIQEAREGRSLAERGQVLSGLCFRVVDLEGEDFADMKIEIFVTSRSLDPVRKDNIVTDERLVPKGKTGRRGASGILAWQVDASRLPSVSGFLKASANGWRKVLSSSLTQRGEGATTIPDRRASAFEILLLRRFYTVYACKEKQGISRDPDACISNATTVIARCNSSGFSLVESL